MATFFTPLQTIWAREYALPGPFAGDDYGNFPVAFALGGPPVTIDFRRSVPPGAKITSIKGAFIDAAGLDVGTGVFEPMISGSFPPAGPFDVTARWYQSAVAPAGDVFDNGGIETVAQQQRAAILAGAAGGEVSAAASSFRGEVHWVNYGCPIGVFHDDNGGAELPPNIPTTLERVRRQLDMAGGGQVNVALPGAVQPINVNSAGGAFVRSDGVVTIAPGDTGVGPDKIPADAASNTGGIFGQHPGVFIRETKAVRGFKLPQGNPAFNYISIDASDPFNPISIVIVDRTPTHSRWILFIDSEQHDVIVQHPAGSNLRRPRDIWNAVFASALQSQSGVGSPLPIFTEAAGLGARNFFQLGELRHLKYLQAAIFAGVLDGSDAPIVVPFPQRDPFVPPPPP